MISRNKKNGAIRLIADKYDFEMQKGITKIPRNIETWLEEPSGGGVPFRIEYKGNIQIEN